MADVKCPMCGRSNPADAEVCEYCQARLKPLIIGGSKSEDPADWLSGLRGGESQPPEENESPQEPTSGGEEPPDWLSRIRARRDADTPGEEEPAAEGQGGLDDWLSGLRQDETPAEETSPDETPQEDTGSPDWLSALQAAMPGAAAEPAAEQAPAEDAEWMSSLTSSEEGETPQAEGEAAPAEDMGWLSAFQDQGQDQGQAPSEPASAEPVESEPAAEEDMGWLSAFQEPGTAPAEPAQAEPVEGEVASPGEDLDWLTSFQDQSQAPAEPTAEEPAAAAPVEDSDWLSAIQSETPGGTEQPAAEASQEHVGGGFTDWLSQLDATPQEESPAQPPAADEQPDWLRAFSTDESPTPSETPAVPFTVPIPGESPAPQAGPSDLVLPGQEIPDWLTNLPTEPVSDLPAAPAFLPDDQLTPTLPPSGETIFEGQEELPEWMGSEEAPAEGAAAGEAAETAEPAEEAPAESLEPAQMPAWLQTMRPVEAVAPLPTAPTSAEDNRVEKAGPLAGLRGLISGAETVTQYKKPPIYSVRLQVTDRQRLHANLLENILTSESQPTAAGKASVFSSQRLWRGLIALLLLVVLLVPLLLNWSAVFPARNPNQAADFVSAMGTLAPGDTVLVAVEYDPGLAAELEGAGQTTLAYLAARGARVVLISTNPAGPALAEQLLLTSGWTAEQVQANSANLGFLPGGNTALAQMASASLQSSIGLGNLFPAALRPAQGWQTPATFKDFKSILLLTDNVDTGRAWVEQIAGALGSTPLLLISSAQSAPILQAYTGAQVKSILSGTAADTSSRAAAFQLGMLVAALLILIGGVVQGFRLLLSRPKQQGEG